MRLVLEERKATQNGLRKICANVWAVYVQCNQASGLEYLAALIAAADLDTIL